MALSATNYRAHAQAGHDATSHLPGLLKRILLELECGVASGAGYSPTHSLSAITAKPHNRMGTFVGDYPFVRSFAMPETRQVLTRLKG